MLSRVSDLELHAFMIGVVVGAIIMAAMIVLWVYWKIPE